jgi:hypothetical protein
LLVINPSKPTWGHKCTFKEGDGRSVGDDGRECDETVPTMEEGGVADREKSMVLDMNMVFEIPAEFRAPEFSVAEMSLGAERAVFEKPIRAREHRKPLFIKGHLDGKPVGQMMVDRGAIVNIMPWEVFERLGH